MSTEQTARETLATLITAKGWTIQSLPIAARSGHKAGRRADQSGHYAFTLRAGHHEYTGEYSVGVAILAEWAATHQPKNVTDRWIPSGWRKGYGYCGLTVSQTEQLPSIRRAYRPDIVDVVWSLLMDVSGWMPECTFREWLRDCGMEWTDPADALDTFEATRREAAFIFRALPDEKERERWMDVAKET